MLKGNVFVFDNVVHMYDLSDDNLKRPESDLDRHWHLGLGVARRPKGQDKAYGITDGYAAFARALDVARPRQDAVQRELTDMAMAKAAAAVRRLQGRLRAGARLLKITPAGEVKLAFEGACCGCSLKAVAYALGIRQKAHAGGRGRRGDGRGSSAFPRSARTGNTPVCGLHTLGRLTGFFAVDVN